MKHMHATTQEGLRKEFVGLSMKYHPDFHPGEFERYNDLMRELLEEYSQLLKTLPQENNTPAQPIHGQARSIYATETAKLIRKQLKRHFPGTKFYVRTSSYSGGASIDIKWIDGPSENQVQSITFGYRGKGFDAMTDCSYYINSWLLPTGGAIPAHSSGSGFGGGFDNPKPHPDAEYVHFGSDHVFLSRGFSKETAQAIIDEAKEQYTEAQMSTDSLWVSHTKSIDCFRVTAQDYNNNYRLMQIIKEFTLYPYNPSDEPTTENVLTDSETQDEQQETQNDTASADLTIDHEGDWTWLKFSDKPNEQVRNTLKEQFSARWSKKRGAWYIRKHIDNSTIMQAIA